MRIKNLTRGGHKLKTPSLELYSESILFQPIKYLPISTYY